jgi:hypothetical protein
MFLGFFFAVVQELFDILLELFEPWILPLMEDQCQETAAWIQQFANTSKVLLPWAPGDVKASESMLAVFTSSVSFLNANVPSARRSAVSHLLENYCKRFAHTAVKDYVLNPVHAHYLTLPWSTFFLQVEDLTRLVTILDAFLPLCHEFVGKVFVEIPWLKVLVKDDTIAMMGPYFTHMIVKLSSEPQVRQV